MMAHQYVYIYVCVCVCVCVCINKKKKEIRTESKCISRKSSCAMNGGMIQRFGGHKKK